MTPPVHAEETVGGLRAWLTEIIVRHQVDYALLWKESEHERHTGGPYAVVLQRRLAQEYRVIEDFTAWRNDEQYLAEWCQRVNRGRREEERMRARQQAELAARMDAMTPAERDEYYAGLEQIKLLVIGLVTRDVQ